MTVTAEEIAAYVDGELDEAARARIMLATLSDPGLADRIAAERGLRDRLQAHFAPVLDEPVPAEWIATIQAGTAAPVIDLAEARAARAPKRWIWSGAAIAASLAIGVTLGQGLHPQLPFAEHQGTLVATGALASALDHQLASAQAPIRILGTFRRQNDLCRVFSAPAASGIACHAGDRWQMQRVFPGAQAQGTAYRQAGSAEADLMAEAQTMAVGDPLDAAQESAAQKAGWR